MDVKPVWPWRPQGLPAYLAALLLVAAALLLSRLPGITVDDRPPPMLFMIPLMVAAYLGGVGPGLFATVLAALACNDFQAAPPYGPADAAVQFRLQWAVLWASGFCGSLLAGRMHRRRRQLQASNAALRQSEARYRTLFEHDCDGVLFTDLEGRIQRANPVFCGMLGYSAEELKALCHQQLTAPRWREAEAAIVRDRVIATGYSGEYEQECIRKDGSTFPVSRQTWLVRDADGRPQGFCCALRDTSRRKQVEAALGEHEERVRLAMNAAQMYAFDWDLAADDVCLSASRVPAAGLAAEPVRDSEHTLLKRYQQELAESRARLSGIVETAMDAIIVVDDRQCIVLFNAAAEKMFRCSRADAIGNPIDRFIPPRFRPAHAIHMRDFAASGTSTMASERRNALRALRSDGDEFPIEASISRVDVGGSKLFTVILRDITEHLRIENELRDADRRKDEFLSMLAHELRNPLAPILNARSIC